MFAIISPAMLNDFDGELRMTASSSNVPIGQNVWPGMMSSQ